MAVIYTHGFTGGAKDGWTATSYDYGMGNVLVFNGTLNRTFNGLIVGKKYTFTYVVRPSVSGATGTWGVTVSDVGTYEVPVVAVNSFNTYAVNFTATQTSHVIGIDEDTNTEIEVDNVQLEDVLVPGSVSIDPPLPEPIKPIYHTRLEIRVGSDWLDITGPTKNINVDRSDSDVGLLSAEVLDADLDPLAAQTLRPGRPIRLRALSGTSWLPVFTGTISDVSVDYEPLAKAGKQVNVKLSANDRVSELANTPENRGVANIDQLRWILPAGTFNVNGSTSAGTGSVVSTNDNASLWDQVQLAKDSALGYAWVGKDNIVYVRDHAQMDATVKATLTPNNYRSVDTDFTLDQIINSVTVQFLRYDIGTETATAIPYGPYEDATSVGEWGRRSAEFTIQGTVEDEAQIAAYAQSILDRTATAVVRPKTAQVRIGDTDKVNIALLELNDRVSVTHTDGTTVSDMRVSGIKHTITAKAWDVELEFVVPTSVSPPSKTPDTGISVVPGGYVTPQEFNDHNNYIDDLIDQIADEVVDLNSTIEAVGTSANGKSTNYFSATAPTGGSYKVGDMWFNSSDNYRMKVWDGNSWEDGTSLVPHQSILSQHVATAGLDAGVIKFGEMEGARIKTGTLQIGQVSGLSGAIAGAQSGAVTQLKNLWGFPSNNTFIDGGKIYTHSIRANQLAIADFTDYVPDPYMELPLGDPNGWSLMAGSAAKWSKVTLGSPYLTPSGRTTMLRLSQTDNNVTYVTTPSFPVEAGENLRVEGRMRRWGGSATGGAFLIGFVFRNAAGAQIGSGYAQIPYNALTTYDNWYDATASATVPVGAVSAAVLIHSNTITTSGGIIVDVSEVHARRMANGRLIVDGAIDGKVITGSVIRTAPSGKRIHLNESQDNAIRLYRGVGTEAPGFIMPYETGSRAGLYITSGARNASSGTEYESVLYVMSGASEYGVPRVYNTTNPSQTPSFGLAGAQVVGNFRADFLETSINGGAWIGTRGLNVQGKIYVHTATTVSAPANTYISTAGEVAKVSSSRRYKDEIRDLETDVDTILSLRPVDFKGLNELDDPDRRYVGFIAEEAHEAGLSQWVEYNEDGEPESFGYPAWPAAQQKVLRAHQERINELEARLEALENA